MKQAKHTIGDLYQMQALPLKAKIAMTQYRIRTWVDHWDGDVYVSFSGGKDSTVLVDIITKMGYTDIPLVFVDTGLEYPEIREFVKGYGDRVTWLRPKLTFKQVVEKYGYPFISKEVAQCVDTARKYLENIETGEMEPTGYSAMADILGIERREQGNKKQYEELKKEIIPSLSWDDKYEFGLPVRLLQLLGKMPHKEKGKLTNEYSKRYDKSKYMFFLDAPFEISADCCRVMKKTPAHTYAKETGRKPFTAQMASESRLRTEQWILNGCNAFDIKEPISNPMSFWTEQDVLLYIKQNNLPICSVYGDVVEDREGTDEVEGQLTMSDVPGWEDQGIFDAKRLPLKTTGCNRTGCMFCGFGCHLEKGEGRFERMKRTHPKQYEYIMRPKDKGGLNYKEVIDWINEHGNMNIKY